MFRQQSTLIVLALLLACASLFADTITIDGQEHSGVYVRESASFYYVQDPSTGKTKLYRKSDMQPEQVQLSADRDAIQAAWKAKSGKETTPVKRLNFDPVFTQSGPDALSAAAEREGTQVLRFKGEEDSAYGQRSDGRVPYIKLEYVPLRDALKATLRPMGLDYKQEGNYLFVSRPDILRRESTERIQYRNYDISPANETLFKVVLQNPGIYSNFQGQIGGSGGGFSGGGINNGGFGQQSGNFGAQNFGGGAGGFGGQRGGAGGFGAQNGGAGGFGGGGQRGGGGYGGADTLSNISQLFTTIDDRRVGESPAYIGYGFATR